MQRPGHKRKGVRRDIGQSLDGLPRRCGLFFLDSGAHSLYTREVISQHHKHGYAYFKSKAFWKYVDGYADFLKKYKDGLDFYANVDVIFNPEITWKVQTYLEDTHGLNPVPIVHYNTPLKWVDKYLSRRTYDLLGVGGLGQEAQRDDYLKWADQLYTHLCKNLRGLPCVKTHGFAMTSHMLMIRYPWWSVDSAAWAKAAGVGNIYVPHKRSGKFVFDIAPYSMGLSHSSTADGKPGRHFYNLSAMERKIIQEWLEVIDLSLGEVDDDGKTVTYGVISEYNARAIANLRYFEKLCEALPPWPWVFHAKPAPLEFFA